MNTLMVDPKIENSWKVALGEEFQAQYFTDLKAFLLDEKSKRTQLSEKTFRSIS